MFKEKFDQKNSRNSHVKPNSSKCLEFQTPCSTLLKNEKMFTCWIYGNDLLSPRKLSKILQQNVAFECDDVLGHLGHL